MLLKTAPYLSEGRRYEVSPSLLRSAAICCPSSGVLLGLWPFRLRLVLTDTLDELLPDHHWLGESPLVGGIVLLLGHGRAQRAT